MKKYFLIVLMSLTVISFNFSQNPITIYSPDFPAVPCKYHPVQVSLTGVTVPVAGANQTWDYSTLSITNAFEYSFSAAANPAFPTADLVDSGYSGVIVPGYYYYYAIYYKKTTSEYQALGTSVVEQRYNISAVTGGSNDSAIFPQLDNVYAAPYKIHSFPYTYNTCWKGQYVDVVNFNLSIAAYMLNNVPSVKKTYATRMDTVVGWGNLTIPKLSGSITAPVLMVKRVVVSIDSFFMNGSPAPVQLLTAFGLTQGQQTVSNRYLFWRKYSIYPFMLFNFGDNNFTTPSSVYIDGDGVNAGTEEISDFPEIMVYPNPACDVLNITCIKDADVIISDLSGKIVKSVKHACSTESIDISEFNAGVYLIKISDQENTITRKFLVSK